MKVHTTTLKLINVTTFALLSLFFINNTFADENLNYSVAVEPALNITTSSNKVSLDLNPLNHDFDSQDLTVSVSTNNETGYKLYVNTEKTTNNPNGNKLIEKDDSNLYIETLSNETPENNFTSNRWGYRIGSGNYLPFASGTLINSSKTQVENNSSTLTFAAKVGYETKAGTYNLALNFQATANPYIPYIQDYDKATCAIEAVDGPVTVIDKRDDKEYTVRWINNNCWMTSNLRFTENTLSSSTSNAASTYTDASPYNITWYSLATDSACKGESMTTTNSTYMCKQEGEIGGTGVGAGQPTVWYNYSAATAHTITGVSNLADATYDICPKGWRLPTYVEAQTIADDASTYVDVFNVVTGGDYVDGVILGQDSGAWVTSTATDGKNRYRFGYHSNENILKTGSWLRLVGRYVRCIRSN